MSLAIRSIYVVNDFIPVKDLEAVNEKPGLHMSDSAASQCTLLPTVLLPVTHIISFTISSRGGNIVEAQVTGYSLLSSSLINL